MAKRIYNKWAEAYLNGVLNRWKWVDIYKLRIEQLRENIIIYGTMGTGDKVQSTPTGDALERKVLKFIEDTKRAQIALLDKINEAEKKQDEAIERIMSMKPGRRRDILYDHYICKISFEELTDRYGYSDGKTIYKVHRRALEYFEYIANREGWKK